MATELECAWLGGYALVRCGVLPRPAQTDMRALDQKDVVRLLRSEVNRAGSQKEWAKENGVLHHRSAWFFPALGRRLRRSSARSNSAGSLYSNELINRTAGQRSARHFQARTPTGWSCRTFREATGTIRLSTAFTSCERRHANVEGIQVSRRRMSETRE
jgi:hypothetical protein